MLLRSARTSVREDNADFMFFVCLVKRLLDMFQKMFSYLHYHTTPRLTYFQEHAYITFQGTMDFFTLFDPFCIQHTLKMCIQHRHERNIQRMKLIPKLLAG